MAEINNVIAEASQDLQTIEDFVNLPADSEVYPRLLPSVNVGTLAGTRDAIFRAGGLPAEPFETKAQMEIDGAALADGQLTMVHNDTANNGLYVKTAGAWVKSGYDPLNQAKSYADATVKSTKTALENSINSKASFLEWDDAPLHAFTDKTGGIVAEIDSNARVVAEDFICGDASLVEISRQTFKAADSNYTHIFADANGYILLGIKKDATLETATGTIGGVSTVGYGVADMRAGYLDSESMNEVGLALDTQSLSKTPIKLLIDVASVGDDETVMQRMPNAVKITDSRFFVLFTQFSTAMDDARNGRLVGRFVDFDINTGSSTVSATVPIAGEKIGDLDRHPVVIQLRDKVVVIYNNKGNLPVQIESYDGCQTWVSKGVISVEGSPLRMVTLNGAVQINSGKYAGRVVLALQTGGKPTVRRFGVWYSDDGCETWQAGFTEVSDIFTGIEYVNEISLALDSQQNMIMAFRSIESAASKRNVIFGKVFDGGHQFEPIGMDPLVDTSWSVFGFAQTAPNLEDGVPRMILSHPASRDTTRRKFRVRVSYDNCQSFVSEYAPLDDTEYAGYSSVIPINNDAFAVVFEQGYHGDSANIKLLVVNLSEIM